MPEVRACVQVCAGVSTNPPCEHTFVVSWVYHAQNRERAGLRGQSCAGGVGRGRRAFRFLRRLFGSDVVPTPTPFRPRRLSDSDAVPTPVPFRPRCLSDFDTFSVPTFFRLRHLFGSDIFSPPASSRRDSAGLSEKNAEKVAKLGGYRVAKDLHGGSAVRRKLLLNQSIILSR